MNRGNGPRNIGYHRCDGDADLWVVDEKGEARPPRHAGQGCICDRPKCTVVCRCGFLVHNRRVCKTCSQHPKSKFLSDLTECPFCKKKTLEEVEGGME